MKWVDVDWINVLQEIVKWRTLVSKVKTLRVPKKKVGLFLTNLQTVSLSGRILLHKGM
jgi:hypothetical protein